jgi:serine O-acetyltransferase
MSKLLFYLKVPLFLPHYILFLICKKEILEYELSRWAEVLRINRKSQRSLFLFIIISLKEYRSLFYHRLGGISKLISWYSPGMINLYFDVSSKHIGKGLVIQHGHSTRFNPASCGENCQIWHNATVGKAQSGGGCPVLGDNVKLTTGSCILGDIIIGNNVVIGAGTIVTKNVPDDCLIVGSPARIVRKNGIRVNIPL